MNDTFLLILVLLIGVLMLVMLAERLKVVLPIFLVLAGLGISFIPGLPVLELDPSIVFLIFLPPILFEAAWYTTWRDFWNWKGTISMMAFGLVFFTSMVVAYASVGLIPGFTLALGFLLGGIISPPDAVSAQAVMKGMNIPRATMTVLSGESLVNDASALIVFRLATAAVVTGQFSMHAAVWDCFKVAGGGVLVGLILVHLFYLILRFLPTTAEMDAILVLAIPYVLYLGAEHFHFSGVMAVVSGGLFLSYRSHDILQTARTRIMTYNFLHAVLFAMNALVFMLIGLSLPSILERLGPREVRTGIFYGLVISGLVILIRIIWTFIIAYVPAMLSARYRIQVRPSWKNAFLVGWSGMRGVVSLATALSIPMWIGPGKEFPFRDTIILMSFVVIFVTLVFQGLSLPIILKYLNIKPEVDPAVIRKQNEEIRMRLNRRKIDFLYEKYPLEIEANLFLQNRIEQWKEYNEIHLDEHDKIDQREHRSDLSRYAMIMEEVHAIERQEIVEIKKENKYSDEQIEHAEFWVDIDELRRTYTQESLS